VTTAAELLTELKNSGVQLSLTDGELEVYPLSKVTEAQIETLGQNGQVIEQLVELQAWQQALNEDQEEFMKGGGSDQFGTFFDNWYAREELLRNVLGYEGCIWGAQGNCEEAVVACENCSPKEKKRRYKSL
tara:strand:- start:79 stop:471 length:393 start_codon:yes stop_codon:yes gene_type:complete